MATKTPASRFKIGSLAVQLVPCTGPTSCKLTKTLCGQTTSSMAFLIGPGRRTVAAVRKNIKATTKRLPLKKEWLEK